MNKIIILIAISMCLNACDATSPQRGEASENRSASFKSFMYSFATIGKMVNGGQAFDAEETKKLAAQFTKEAREPFQYFQNDPNGNGRALPNIWQQPNAFHRQQEQFFAAVDALNQAAQTGKMDDISAAVGKVEQQCQACHHTYRAP